MAALFVVLISVVAHLTAGQMFAGTGTQRAGFGFGGFGLNRWNQNQNGFNPFLNQTITCTFSEAQIVGSLTLVRMQQQQQAWGNWAWGRNQQQQVQPSGNLIIRTGTTTGDFSVVFTERSRDCTTDGLGPVVVRQNNNLWGRRWGAWGAGTGTTTMNTGVVATVTLAANQETVLDLSTLPFNTLRQFAGRGLALCQMVSTGADGRQTCAGIIPACCRLGFDNMEAMTPAAPEDEDSDEDGEDSDDEDSDEDSDEVSG